MRVLGRGCSIKAREEARKLRGRGGQRLAFTVDTVRGLNISITTTAKTDDEAKALLPARYTGFSPATHASYATIERAGIAVGRLKKLAA